jgi:hypothetical protein
MSTNKIDPKSRPASHKDPAHIDAPEITHSVTMEYDKTKTPQQNVEAVLAMSVRNAEGSK